MIISICIYLCCKFINVPNALQKPLPTSMLASVSASASRQRRFDAVTRSPALPALPQSSVCVVNFSRSLRRRRALTEREYLVPTAFTRAFINIFWCLCFGLCALLIRKIQKFKIIKERKANKTKSTKFSIILRLRFRLNSCSV